MVASDDQGRARKKSGGKEQGDGGDGLSPTARRQKKHREERQKLIRQQVDEGTLTIREMTPEEREKYPPRPRRKKG